MNFLDGLIILFVIMGAFKGRRNGLAAIVGKFLSILAAIIMAIISYRPVAEFLDNGFGLIDTIYTFLGKRLDFAQGVGSVQIRDVPFGSLVQSAKSQDLSAAYEKFILGFLKDIQTAPTQHGITGLGQGVVYYMAQFLVNAIAFLLVFFFIIWIFRWFFKARKKKKFTIIGSFNRLGGFLVGGASSFLKIAIVIVLMAPFVTFNLIGNNSGFFATLGKQIAGSLIANNIINLVAKIIS